MPESKSAKKQISSSDKTARPIAEVVGSTVTSVIAQCWQENDEHGMPSSTKPNFGSFIRIDCAESGLSVIAVVCNVLTGPQDSVHKPAALGLSRDELRMQQPHIFALLRTEVHATTIGYLLHGAAKHHLPPQPPEVHDFVFQATSDEIRKMTTDFDFLRLLIDIRDVPSDELISASIREAYAARDDDYQFLVAAGQALSQIMRADYDRLVSILKKIKPE